MRVKSQEQSMGLMRKAMGVALPAIGLLACLLVTGCGEGVDESQLPGPTDPTGPAAGRYAYARNGNQLVAIPLDAQTSSPITLVSLATEQDFSLPVELVTDPVAGKGRYHDQLLVNGGQLFWLSGRGDGKKSLVQELKTPGFTVRSCGHISQPDDAAVSLVKTRVGDAVAEVNINFAAVNGCIDPAGDKTLSVVLATKAATVRTATEFRVGLQADGSALGTLKVGDGNLVYSYLVNGVGQQQTLSPAAADMGRIIDWRVLARDSQGMVLCGRTDADKRCALYYFDPTATPLLSKLSADDYEPVQMAGIAKGRVYIASKGPVSSTQLRVPSIHEFELAPPFTSRLAVSLPVDVRSVSIQQSLLFYAQDTIRFSQYTLVDAASGATRNTDLVFYGSGASSLFADHRIGCVVTDAIPASPELSPCDAQAWVTPNYVNGVLDRTVYLAAANGSSKGNYTFTAIASVVGFVGYETAADVLVAVRLGDASSQLWRVPRVAGGQKTLLMQGDTVLYGTIRPRGSVL